MTTQILTIVRSRDFTTFQDLSCEVPGFRGDQALFRPDRPDIIIWHACSREACFALSELMATGEIRYEVAPSVSYRTDLELPALKICRDTEIFERPIGETVWFPLVIVEGYEGLHGEIREGRFV